MFCLVLFYSKMIMERLGRAWERCETPGCLKVLIDIESEKILSATILGISGVKSPTLLPM